MFQKCVENSCENSLISPNNSELMLYSHWECLNIYNHSTFISTKCKYFQQFMAYEKKFSLQKISSIELNCRQKSFQVCQAIHVETVRNTFDVEVINNHFFMASELFSANRPRTDDIVYRIPCTESFDQHKFT